ncbi:MAG: hypothetical protein IPM48_05170 [Saprospiraceae bacterium]|nr:hypothetical protein [Saprospiraceae bacterium]
MNLQEKEHFLKNELIHKLHQLDPEARGLWGKMNAHQMVEHLVDAFKIGNGRTVVKDILTPLDKIEKIQAFVLSDIPFKENTKNVLLSEEPEPIRNPNYQEVIHSLAFEIEEVFRVYDQNEKLLLRNPIFGDLGRQLQISLLHKHASNHLRQFGVME